MRIYLYTEAPGNRERVRGMRLCYFIEETRELIRVSLETNRENMHQDKHKNVHFLTLEIVFMMQNSSHKNVLENDEVMTKTPVKSC